MSNKGRTRLRLWMLEESVGYNMIRADDGRDHSRWNDSPHPTCTLDIFSVTKPSYFLAVDIRGEIYIIYRYVAYSKGIANKFQFLISSADPKYSPLNLPIICLQD
jgi:hypothetical protein